MVPVIQRMCKSDRYSVKCPFSRTPRFIVVHNTGNTAPAQNEVDYMLRRNDEVSFHVAVDDKQIIEAISFNRNAWASGDGQGNGNMYGIHIEICYSNYTSANESTYKCKFLAAERNAAEYIANLLKKYGWGIEKVTKHQDYDGKYCPHRTLDLGWNRFLEMVKGYMSKEEIDLTKDEVVKIVRDEFAKLEAEKTNRKESEWAKSAVKFVKEKKIMSGDANGNFRPQSNITRQEVAQVVKNLFDALAVD